MIWLIVYLVIAIVMFVITMALYYFGESFGGHWTPFYLKILISAIFGISWPIVIPVMLYVTFCG